MFVEENIGITFLQIIVWWSDFFLVGGDGPLWFMPIIKERSLYGDSQKKRFTYVTFSFGLAI
jgi:hypothetical protein